MEKVQRLNGNGLEGKLNLYDSLRYSLDPPVKVLLIRFYGSMLKDYKIESMDVMILEGNS